MCVCVQASRLREEYSKREEENVWAAMELLKVQKNVVAQAKQKVLVHISCSSLPCSFYSCVFLVPSLSFLSGNTLVFPTYVY